jgi:hypothetical protein
MKDRVKILALFFGLSLLLFFNSCIKEEFDAKKVDKEFVINPAVAAPLGYIHYELNEILDDSARAWEITVGEDSLISLEYEAEVYSKQASELLQFPEIAGSDSILNNSKYDLDLGLIGWYYDLKQTDTINLLLSGPDGPINTQIDSIQVDSLIINVNRLSKYMLRGKMILTSPKIRKKYGNTWAYWAAAIPVLGPVQNVVAEDVTIILSHDLPDVNIVPLVFELRLDQSRGIVPAGFTILNYSFTTIDLDFDAIYGKLGQMNFPIGPQDMVIDFYSDLNKGTFHFAEPRLKFIFENSFGLPIQIITNDLYAASAGGTITEITGSGLPSITNELIINYPTLKEVGEAAYDSLIINYNEANLVEALNSSPGSITFGMEARTNPQNDDTYNFVTDESRLKVISKLILPIDGYTEFLNIEDSVRYNFADFFRNPPREIKRMALRLNFTNGFPVDIRSQIYLLDGNHNIVDSLFDEEYTIKAGIDPDGDGMVEPTKSDPVEVELTRAKIDNVVISRYFYFKGRLNTLNSDIPENYKFYSFYFLDAYIGVVGDLELNSTGN